MLFAFAIGADTLLVAETNRWLLGEEILENFCQVFK